MKMKFQVHKEKETGILQVLTLMVLILEKKITARFFFEKEISNAKKLRGVFVNLHKRSSEIN